MTLRLRQQQLKAFSATPASGEELHWPIKIWIDVEDLFEHGEFGYCRNGIPPFGHSALFRRACGCGARRRGVAR